MTGTIYEFCDTFHVSQHKARKMEKAGWLRLNGASFFTDAIRAAIAKGNGPTAMQLVELIENPGGLLELGKYAGTAEREIAKLGNPRSQVAPKEVAANIMEAAKGEPEAVQILVDWLKGIIPAESPVTHAYIATRLLLGVPANIRKFEGPRIPRALLNVRQHPSFAGYWQTEKQASRNVTLYQKRAFDL